MASSASSKVFFPSVFLLLISLVGAYARNTVKLRGGIAKVRSQKALARVEGGLGRRLRLFEGTDKFASNFGKKLGDWEEFRGMGRCTVKAKEGDEEDFVTRIFTGYFVVVMLLFVFFFFFLAVIGIVKSKRENVCVES